MNQFKALKWLSVFASLSLLTGCNLVSSPSLLQQPIIERQVDSNAFSNISTSLQTMDHVHSYQLKASLKIKTGEFTKTVGYFGDILLPSTISLNETIDGLNYQLYQSGHSAYFNSGSGWQSATPVSNLTPWVSLSSWFTKAHARTIYRLPNQVVLSYVCQQYQFEGVLPHQLLDSSPYLKSLDPQKALYTLWIDQSDHYLRQLEIQSTASIPGIGSVAVNSMQLFASINYPFAISNPIATKG